jgi:hypothetical protein
MAIKIRLARYGAVLIFFILTAIRTSTAQILPPLPPPLNNGSLNPGSVSFVPPFSLSASPASPNPHQNVVIKANSPTFDEYSAQFTWTINGRRDTTLSGLGKDTITIPAGNAGSSIPVDLEVRLPDGTILTTSLKIYVTDLVIVWDTNTYIPPWYEGKALPIQSSIVRLVAMPHISLDGHDVPIEQLIYSWQVDGKRVLTGSGERILRISAPQFAKRGRTVILTIEDITKRVKKEARIMITPFSPRVGIYSITPLGGVEFRRNVILPKPDQSQIDLIAEPFYFNMAGRNSLSYQWRVDYSPVQGTPENPSIITFKTDDVSGTIPVSVRVDSADTLIPAVSKFIQLVLP